MKRYLTILYIILFALLGVFTFLDYPLSSALVREDSLIGESAAIGVYAPVYFLALLSALCLMRAAHHAGVAYLYFWLVSLGGVYVLVAALFIYQILDQTDAWVPWVLVVLPLMVSASIRLALWIKKADLVRHYRLPLLYLTVFFLMNIGFNILKFLWVRIRFFALETPSDFSPWFIPQGFFDYSEALSSMPSGHVGTAALLIGVGFLPLTIRPLRKYWTITNIVIGAFIVWTALGRIMDGKHYATDTIVSVLLVFTLFVVLGRLFVFTKK